MVWPIDPRPTCSPSPRPRRDDSTAAGTWGKPECEQASLEGVRPRHDRMVAISGDPEGDPTSAGQVTECRSRCEAMLCEHNAKRAAGLCRPTSPDSRGSVAKVHVWTSRQVDKRGQLFWDCIRARMPRSLTVSAWRGHAHMHT